MYFKKASLILTLTSKTLQSPIDNPTIPSSNSSEEWGEAMYERPSDSNESYESDWHIPERPPRVSSNKKSKDSNSYDHISETESDTSSDKRPTQKRRITPHYPKPQKDRFDGEEESFKKAVTRANLFINYCQFSITKPSEFKLLFEQLIKSKIDLTYFQKLINKPHTQPFNIEERSNVGTLNAMILEVIKLRTIDQEIKSILPLPPKTSKHKRSIAEMKRKNTLERFKSFIQEISKLEDA